MKSTATALNDADAPTNVGPKDASKMAAHIGPLAQVLGSLGASAPTQSASALYQILALIPAAIYVTDGNGKPVYFKNAEIEFSGRVPDFGTDLWCVTWKLYYPDGTYMPHDECPTAVALKEGRSIRGAEAIAERPDGTRVWFTPYPTPS